MENRMKQKSFIIGMVAICLLGAVCAGCAKEDNGPSTRRNSMDQVLTPAQRAAIQNNPKLPPRVKALELGFNPTGTAVPPQYRGGQGSQGK